MDPVSDFSQTGYGHLFLLPPADAINALTQAIQINPSSENYECRAWIYYLQRDYPRAKEDCERAKQSGGNNYRPYLTMGLCILESNDELSKEELTATANEFEMSLDLVIGDNETANMVESVWEPLAKAKYKLWELSSEQKANEFNRFKQTCEEVFKGEIEKLETLYAMHRKALEEDCPKEVPHHLCCGITFEIFRDPVITPYGITYERAAILRFLKGKSFYPTTNAPLVPAQLVPNLAIRGFVKAFLDKHGWAVQGVVELQL